MTQSLSAWSRLFRRRRPRPGRLSPLTLRILAVNVTAPVILAVGLLFLDRYQEGLIQAEIEALQSQALLVGGALAEGAVALDDDGEPTLAPIAVRPMIRRLAAPTRARTQVFDATGQGLADSFAMLRSGGLFQVLPLEERSDWSRLRRGAEAIYDWMFNALPRRDQFPPYRALPIHQADAYPEALAALQGDIAARAYLAADGHLVFTVAVPIQRYRQVVGVLMLSRSSTEIDSALRRIRLDILTLFALGLGATVLLSLYLAGTISYPLHRLAAAAERLRQGQTRGGIPDFAARRDEIGDLSVALRAMTQALHQRMEAIERFAADVSHEIKNPLTSLRSAIETASRVKDPDQQRRLMAIVLQDIQRLDRLITDIAQASRLDAELARIEPTPVDLTGLAHALAEVHAATHEDEPDAPKLLVEASGPVKVMGVEDRLVQVMRNLITNALSFSPPNGAIRLIVQRQTDKARLMVEDSGPGLPPGKEEAIFQRFYSERPKAEGFGLHSGLGLSISRQIVEAHGGTLTADNRRNEDGRILGARFTVDLPVAAP